MRSESLATRDPFEVDEPTHPFTRAEINRLREQSSDLADISEQAQEPDDESPAIIQSAGPTAGIGDDPPPRGEDWFQLEGRWLRVSLEPFANFGMNGTPPGMIGCAEVCFVSGTINGPDSVPTQPLPRLTEVYQVAPPEPVQEWEEPLQDGLRPSKRVWGALGVIGSLAVVLGVWGVIRPSEEPEQPTVAQGEVVEKTEEPELREESVPPTPEPVEPVLPEPTTPDKEEPVVDVADVSKKKTPKSSNPSSTPECVSHRESAMQARQNGEWEQLEKLAQRRECWRSKSEAKALRMQALFQLERFRQCVGLGGNDNAKEVQQWVSTCQRAVD